MLLKIIFWCILTSYVGASTICVLCRDFPGPYAGIAADEEGSVKLSQTLDIYGKPSLSATSTVIANTTEMFNTIEGVNKELTVFKIDYNIAYHNPTLYQFDGQGYGNQGNDHNYYFTCELYGEGTAKTSDKLYLGTVDESWAYINGEKVISNPKNGIALSDKTYNMPNNGYIYLKMFMSQRNINASELHFETNLINIITIDNCVAYIYNRTYFYANQTTPSPSPTPSSNVTTPSSNTSVPTPSSNTSVPTPSSNTSVPTSNTSVPTSSPTPVYVPTNMSVYIPSSNFTFENVTQDDFQEYGIAHKVLFSILMILLALGITAVLYFLYKQKKKREERRKETETVEPVKLQGFLIE